MAVRNSTPPVYAKRDLARFVFVLAFAPTLPCLIYFGTHVRGGAGVLLILFIIPFYFIVCAYVLILLLLRCVRFQIHKSPLLVGSAIILALVVPLGRLETVWIDWVRFQIHRDYYETQVLDKSTSDTAPRIYAFDWGEIGAFGSSNFNFLVFDDSGEIALPNESRSHVWKDKVASSKLPLQYDGCHSSAIHLTGNFYSFLAIC